MKYKMLGITMALFMLGFTVLVLPFEHQEGQNQRIHQHKVARKDTGCDCQKTELCSHLPLLIMNTRGQVIPGEPTEERDYFGERIYSKTPEGESYINIDVAVIDNQTKNNHPSDEPAFTTVAECRIRGHMSRHFEKKPYLLRFIHEDTGKDNDLVVMGMGRHNEWALHGPYQDKSLLRNYMWYNISGEIMEYAPNVRFCELIVDGDYRGIYVLTETITDGEDCRLNLTERVKGSELTGYLIRQDRPTMKDLDSIRDLFTFCERMEHVKMDIAVSYPGVKKLTKETKKMIEKEYSEFEKCLYSYDYDTEKYGYWNWIDVESCIDYFLINEFSANTDSGKYSTYIYKELGGKYKWCVWDFNDSCDNGVVKEMPVNQLSMVSKPMYFMLTKDEDFVEQLLQRYKILRKGVLSDKYIVNYIDETIEYLGPAIERNTARWSSYIENDGPLNPVERNVHSQAEAANKLKGWLVRRGQWLDENLHVLKAVCHDSRNHAYNH